MIKKIKRMIKKTAKIFLPKSHIEIIARFIFAEAIEGDYLEFGVFRGASFINAYYALEAAKRDWNSKKRDSLAYSLKHDVSIIKRKDNIKYFAFDSFCGLPEIKGIDKEHARFSKGRFDCAEKEFLTILKSNGVDLGKVDTIPGWYNSTLNEETKKKYGINRAAVVMIDCDLYESAKDVLRFITDLLTNGSVIIFDDWFSFKGDPDRGEQKAVKEWLNKNIQIRLIEYYNNPPQKSFIVNIVNDENAK